MSFLLIFVDQTTKLKAFADNKNRKISKREVLCTSILFLFQSNSYDIAIGKQFPPPCQNLDLSSIKFKSYLIHKCFNSFPNKPWFSHVCSTSLWKTLWEKEKLLVTSNFSFSHSVFYPFRELSAIFVAFEIVICKLFQFGRV